MLIIAIVLSLGAALVIVNAGVKYAAYLRLKAMANDLEAVCAGLKRVSAQERSK